jgi:DNA-binding NarL/FixJ family response regulator
VKAWVKDVLSRPNIERLTYTQRRVLVLMLEGLAHKEIAARMHVEVRTTIYHATCIYKRLGVGDRIGLWKWHIKYLQARKRGK